MCMLGKQTRSSIVPKAHPRVLWRLFDIYNDGRGKVILDSLLYRPEHTWHKRGVVKADKAPNRSNRHGLYGYKSAQAASRGRYGQSTYVVARIEVWGHIAWHTNGARAEFAKITHVYFGRLNKTFHPETCRKFSTMQEYRHIRVCNISELPKRKAKKRK